MNRGAADAIVIYLCARCISEVVTILGRLFELTRCRYGCHDGRIRGDDIDDGAVGHVLSNVVLEARDFPKEG